MRLLIPLLKLDTFFPEEVYLQGELLYDNKGIERVNELYKGKVMMMMSDKNKVEMRFNKDNIVDVYCSCQQFKVKKMCPHVVASALEVRKLATKMQKKATPYKTRQRRKKANLFDEILQVLDKEDLTSFLSGYAQKDKNFRLVFEAFFMNKLKDKNLDNPYGNLLDEVLPPSSGVDVKFSRQQITLLNNIAKDLLAQYKDAVSLNKLTDAFNIIKHLINKLSYAYNRNTNESLGDLLAQAHDAFYLMFEETMAPELKAKSYEFIYDMIKKSYYFYQKENDLIHLFMDTKPLREDVLALVDVLNHKIRVLRNEDEGKKYFITFYIGLKKRYGKLEDNWYEVYFKDLTDFMGMSHILLKEGFGKELEELLTELYAKEKISKRLFLESQLRISLSQDDCERVGFLIKDLYENTYDFRYLARAKKCVKAFSKDVKESIGKVVESQAPEDEKMTWWMMTGDMEKLVNHLEHKNDISLIQVYEDEIFKDNPDNLQRLYLNYIHNYLREHFGQRSVSVVKNLLYHLRQIGAKKIAFNIEKDLFDTFSSRKRFLKDLMDI